MSDDSSSFDSLSFLDDISSEEDNHNDAKNKTSTTLTGSSKTEPTATSTSAQVYSETSSDSVDMVAVYTDTFEDEEDDFWKELETSTNKEAAFKGRVSKKITNSEFAGEPVTWEDVERLEENFNIEDFEGNFTTSNNRDEYLNYMSSNVSNLTDPLGLGKDIAHVSNELDKARRRQQSELHPSSENFSPTKYLAVIHKKTPLSDLKDGLTYLNNKVNSREVQLRNLVMNNFSSYVGCKDTISDIYQRVSRHNEDSAGIEDFAGSISWIYQLCDELFQPLLERQESIDERSTQLNILAKVQFKYVLNIRATMLKDFDNKDYSKVIFHYKKVKTWLADTQIEIFKQVLEDAEAIIARLNLTLINSLDEKLNLKEQERIIGSLLSLGLVDTNLEDPAWKCINDRQKFMIKELKSTRKNRKGRNSNIVQRLADVIMDNFPDFWKMVKSFYRGDYHSGTNININAGYPEPKFALLMEELITTYTDSIKVILFGKNIPANKNRVRTRSRTSSVSISKIGIANPLKRSSPRYHSVNNSRSPRGVKTPHVITQEEDMKTSLIHYRNSFNLLKGLVHIKYIRPMQSLLDELTLKFVKDTFAWALSEAKTLYTMEEYEISDQSLLISYLPVDFSTLVQQLILEFSNIIEPEDPIILEIDTHMIQMLNNYADNIHHLAFNIHTDNELYTGVHRYTHNNILVLINNCTYGRKVVIPSLIRTYLHNFNREVLPLSNSIDRLLRQLEGLLVKKYIRKIALKINKIVSRGMLNDYDWNSRKNITAIRDYVMELLLEMVNVHEELYGKSDEVRNILSLLLECIYQAYLDTIPFMDEFPPYGKLQTGTEIEFINTVLSAYKTGISTRLYEEINSKISFKALMNDSDIPKENRRAVTEVLEKQMISTALLFGCFKEL
eukprot:TRINITY_DN11580_c0_g1_i1.p1 TRINITY_DN11580_c0_g1~~TRINITY_DN11580_c0_g1_i1.p1  ORF type:complete len:899 (-),score=184.58 TRINITY_DN11580_c0_g1_i1:33-2729(-)